MARRGNVFRLPVPPPLSGKISDMAEDTKTINDHLNLMTTIINQGLQSLQNRMNTVQQVTAKTPPTVTGLTVAGKQGLFYLTWNRIAHTDGYIVIQASDTGMTQLVGRFNLPDGETCTYSVQVGNVAVTNSFQIYSYQGQKISEPSATVTATTVPYGAAEAAPPAPPIAPRQPKKVPPRSGPNL